MTRRRLSPGLMRADTLRAIAAAAKREAETLGLANAAQLADDAETAAFNARSGYEAAKMVDTGGSSQSWALRRHGADWQRKGRRWLDQARAEIEAAKRAKSEETE